MSHGCKNVGKYTIVQKVCLNKPFNNIFILDELMVIIFMQYKVQRQYQTTAVALASLQWNII